MVPTELQMIEDTVFETIKNIYTYKNSVLGILEIVGSDYSNLKLNTDEIINNLSNGENIELLQAVLTKLG